MRELSETLLSRFYKKCKTNGKMELFGVDGANHGFYALIVTIIAGLISRNFVFIIALLIMVITSAVITTVFFVIELEQEKTRIRKHHLKGNADDWYHSENAQRNDFLIPTIVSIIISSIFIFMRVL